MQHSLTIAEDADLSLHVEAKHVNTCGIHLPIAVSLYVEAKHVNTCGIHLP